jgi:hypothetical protein
MWCLTEGGAYTCNSKSESFSHLLACVLHISTTFSFQIYYIYIKKIQPPLTLTNNCKKKNTKEKWWKTLDPNKRKTNYKSIQVIKLLKKNYKTKNIDCILKKKR